MSANTDNHCAKKKRARIRYLGLALLAICGVTHAAGARIGLEHEREKDTRCGMHSNNAFTAEADSTGFRERETKVFVRLCHNRKLNKSVGYDVRDGVGRSLNNGRDSASEGRCEDSQGDAQAE